MKIMIKLATVSILLLFNSCTQRAFTYKLKGSYSLIKRENNFLKDSTLIKGTIKDKKNTIPIANGVINLEGMKLGAATDIDGQFIVKVPSGKYKICAICTGYTNLCTKEITFNANEIITINFYLGTTIIE